MSCQQPVARATPRSSRPARTCSPSLGATQGPGSHARLGPFPVQARGDGHGRDRSRRNSCFGGHSSLGGRGRPCGMDLGPGTHSWRRVLQRGEADTTTSSMPRGCWLYSMWSAAQGAYGNWSSSLFGGFNECTGWAWGARALGCLRRKDRKTPPSCSRSLQPQGLQRPTRLLTRVASALLRVSEPRGQGGRKARLGFPGAGFGQVYSAGGRENPGGTVVGIQGLT